MRFDLPNVQGPGVEVMICCWQLLMSCQFQGGGLGVQEPAI